MQKLSRPVARYAVLFIAFFAASASAGTLPVIESITGGKTVDVQAAGRTKAARVGHELKAGDVIQTSPAVSVRLLYTDGSQLLIGRSSQVEIQARQNNAESSYHRLGQVRAVIAKAKKPQPKGRPRFTLRTKSAVMGVRGTDFVVATDEKGEAADVHTLDGKVEVAKDEESLINGKGLVVAKDQFLAATLGEWKKPAKFDRSKYLNDLKAQQPDFQSLLQQKVKARKELDKLRQQATGAQDQAAAKADAAKARVSNAKTQATGAQDQAAAKAQQLKSKLAAPSAVQTPALAAPAVTVPVVTPPKVTAPKINVPNLKKNPFGR